MRDHRAVSVQHAAHFAQEQDVSGLQFLSQVDKQILCGSDGTAAHVIQRHVAVDQGHEIARERLVDRVGVEVLELAVVAAGGGGGLHAQYRHAGVEEGIGDDAVEACCSGGDLGVSTPLDKSVDPLLCVVGLGGPVTEGAGAVADEELRVWIGVKGLAYLVSQTRDELSSSGVGAGFVGDEGATELEEVHFLHCRDCEGECAALSPFAFEPDLAAVHLHQVFGDGQAQPGAGDFVHSRVVGSKILGE